MLFAQLLLTAITVMFTKEAYDSNKIEYAMFWACLTGWNFHTLLGLI